MAKRSRKLFMQREKNQGGCIWSLVSKLHPRNHRSTQKLLLDKGLDGRGLSRSNSDSTTMYDTNVGNNPLSLITNHGPCYLKHFRMDSVSKMESNWFSQDSERTESIAMKGMPSVKTLMEEEMIIEANADSRQRKYQSTRPDRRIEQSSADDIRNLLEYLSRLFRQRDAICGEGDEEKFNRYLAKVQVGSGKQLTEGEKFRRSKVIVSMLQILNSSECSLLDPEMTFNKFVEILHETQLGRSSLAEGEDGPYKMNVESSSVSSRIVILEPGMTELRKPGKVLNVGALREIKTIGTKGQKTISDAPSFLSDIKRKLKNVVAEEYSDLTADAVVPNESDPGITSSYTSGNTRDLKKNWHKREGQPCRQFPSTEMSLVIEEGNDDDQGVANDLPERPSPVSVLEPPFSDDDISPAVVKRGEFQREHMEIELQEDDICIAKVDELVRTMEEDKESVSDQVRVLLKASDLKWEDLYLKSQNLDGPMEPSLLYDPLFFKDNAKLLVDCVNEALLEACACFFGRSCLALVKQRIKPVPSMDFTIHEACRVVKWHLNPIPLPRSLEQIVGKDMSRRGLWLDLTFEGEGIGSEVCESIFSELLREIVISSVDEFSEGTCQLKIRRPS